MKIIATSKASFDGMMFRKEITPLNVENQDKLAFISLNNTVPLSDYDNPFFPTNKKNVKVMFFDDVSKDQSLPLLDGSNVKYEAKAFTVEQAKELYGFIKDVIPGKEAVMIHCTMGVSRSGAVASFIHDYVKGDWDTFKRNNPQIQPNAHVYKLLQDQWGYDRALQDFENPLLWSVEVLNPLTKEQEVAAFNLRHPDQHISLKELSLDQIEEKYGKEVRDNINNKQQHV